MFRESQINVAASQFEVNTKDDIKDEDLNMIKILKSKSFLFLQNKAKGANKSSFLTRSKVTNLSFKLLTSLKKRRKQKQFIKKCLKRMKKTNKMFLMIKNKS